jgi:hypothetical protein
MGVSPIVTGGPTVKGFAVRRGRLVLAGGGEERRCEEAGERPHPSPFSMASHRVRSTLIRA